MEKLKVKILQKIEKFNISLNEAENPDLKEFYT